MPSKKCKNPSCTETNPEFYSHRNLCKKCYLEHKREARKKPKPNIELLEKEIKELKDVINMLTEKLDKIIID